MVDLYFKSEEIKLIFTLVETKDATHKFNKNSLLDCTLEELKKYTLN